MVKNFKLQLLLLLLVCAFLSTGCVESSFKPPVALEVPSVSTYELYATATDTASLPTTAVTVTSLNKIPCNLKSYSVHYTTQYGDPLPQLTISAIPMEMKLDGEANITVTVKPYTKRVIDLFELSTSEISPLTAEITLTFKDYNGNWVSKDAHCLLYAPE